VASSGHTEPARWEGRLQRGMTLVGWALLLLPVAVALGSVLWNAAWAVLGWPLHHSSEEAWDNLYRVVKLGLVEGGQRAVSALKLCWPLGAPLAVGARALKQQGRRIPKWTVALIAAVGLLILWIGAHNKGVAAAVELLLGAAIFATAALLVLVDRRRSQRGPVRDSQQ
jgi:hypothetical protein